MGNLGKRANGKKGKRANVSFPFFPSHPQFNQEHQLKIRTVGLVGAGTMGSRDCPSAAI